MKKADEEQLTKLTRKQESKALTLSFTLSIAPRRRIVAADHFFFFGRERSALFLASSL